MTSRVASGSNYGEEVRGRAEGEGAVRNTLMIKPLTTAGKEGGGETMEKIREGRPERNRNSEERRTGERRGRER